MTVNTNLPGGKRMSEEVIAERLEAYERAAKLLEELWYDPATGERREQYMLVANEIRRLAAGFRKKLDKYRRPSLEELRERDLERERLQAQTEGYFGLITEGAA